MSWQKHTFQVGEKLRVDMMNNLNTGIEEAVASTSSLASTIETTYQKKIIPDEGFILGADNKLKFDPVVISTVDYVDANISDTMTYIIQEIRDEKAGREAGDNLKQDKLIAGSGIIIALDGKTISAGSTVTMVTDSTITLQNSDTKIVTNTPTSLSITLPYAESGRDYLTGVIFKAGDNFAMTETAPTGYTVVYDEEPTWTAGNIYEIIYRYLGIDGIISAKYSEVVVNA